MITASIWCAWAALSWSIFLYGGLACFINVKAIHFYGTLALAMAAAVLATIAVNA